MVLATFTNMSQCRMSFCINCTILWPGVYCIAILSVVPLYLKAVNLPPAHDLCSHGQYINRLADILWRTCSPVLSVTGIFFRKKGPKIQAVVAISSQYFFNFLFFFFLIFFFFLNFIWGGKRGGKTFFWGAPAPCPPLVTPLAGTQYLLHLQVLRIW